MAISTIFKVDENGYKKQLIKYADKIIGKRQTSSRNEERITRKEDKYSG